ncbi:MAG TPA: tetratricopeptide repeat protein [Gammaproteobacteria bacterium]
MQTDKVRFGPFELDFKAGELRRGGRRMRLQEKPLLFLRALIERPGEIVTREELRARLWPPNIVVDFDNGLNNAANKLRALLDDSVSAPKYIETVGRRGYRFIGEVIADERDVPAAATGTTTDRSNGSASPGFHGWRTSVAALALGSAVVVAIVAALSLLYSGRAPEPRIRSIAVLPLDNLSNDPQQEYFSEGMTDALISQLAGIRSLHVISRQSIMRYKESTLPMPAIAAELDVDGLIEGTVLRTDGRVRVSVQLIHGPTDNHVWSEQYERPLGDVLGLQAEIASSVAREVAAAVTSQEDARLERVAAIDAEAYDLYLRGRYFWARRTKESLLRAVEYFDRAVAIEPEFALAHAAIAEAYGPLGYVGYVPAGEAALRMRASAERALEIDPDLVEGLTALGACAAFHEWHWAEGERHFQRALEINSNYATTYMWYGLLFENEGRHEESVRLRRRAVELDPLGVAATSGLGQALFLSGRIDEAIDVLERTLELEPESPQPLGNLGEIYVATGRYEEAIDAFRRAGELGAMGHAYALAGRRKEAFAVLAALERQAQSEYVSPHALALVHLGLGDSAAALDALEQGFAVRDPAMSGLKVDPRFAPLAREPRFLALLEKMGLR